MPSIGQTWVLAYIGAVVEMSVLSTLKRLPMESTLSQAKISTVDSPLTHINCGCERITCVWSVHLSVKHTLMMEAWLQCQTIIASERNMHLRQLELVDLGLAPGWSVQQQLWCSKWTEYSSRMSWPAGGDRLKEKSLHRSKPMFLLVQHGPDRSPCRPLSLSRGMPIPSDLSDFPPANISGNDTYVFKV
jgi:hypothetical protein